MCGEDVETMEHVTPQRAKLKEKVRTEKELGNLKGTGLECVNARRALGRESFLK
jgi:hypothetical protein